MKKLLGILAISALASAAFAQGLVGFINNSAGLVREWTTATDPTLISVPVGGGHVELLTAPAGTAFNSLGSLSGVGFTATYTSMSAFLNANPSWAEISTTGLTPVAGRFNGGTATLQAAIAGGANAEYVLIGWTGSATTFNDAYTAALAGTAFIGSGPMLTTTTGSGGTPPIAPTLLSTTFTGMTLAPLVIPEPTSFALAGLGLAALVAFRRRS
jgi:hypothetical protein